MNPCLNHFTRCAEDPCVHDSWFTCPCVASWMRSSPTAAAASSAVAMSASETFAMNPVSTAFAAHDPA